MEEKRKKKGRWIPWLLLLLLAAALAALPMLTEDNSSTGVSAAVKSAAASVRQMDTVLISGGQLESNSVTALQIPENVKLTEYLVSNGDLVTKGQAIARVDPVTVMTAIAAVQDTLVDLSEQINKADSSQTTTSITVTPGGKLKKLYASVGDSVEDVMLKYGCLAVFSLDDTMAVTLNQAPGMIPGDKVSVTIGSETVTGRVRANTGDGLVVSVDDNDYAIGAFATVTAADGSPLGSGSLYVYSAWEVLATAGNVTAINGREGQTYSKNQSFITIKETGKSSEYRAAIDKRQKYEALIYELFTLRSSGVITAPCDGIITGIDKDGAYLLSDFSSAEEDSYRIVFLREVDYEVIIVNQSLPGGTVGIPYSTVLQAAKGDEIVSGSWTVSGLPAGLQLDSASGLISGTPTKTGSFTVTVSFDCGEDSSRPVNFVLTIDPSAAKVYTGYPARITIVSGDAIQVLQTAEPYSITDTAVLPSVSADSLTLSVQASYRGQDIVNGNFQVGDLVWIILESTDDDSSDTVPIATSVTKISTGGSTPGGGSGSGGSGGPSGSGGSGGADSGGSGSGGSGSSSRPSSGGSGGGIPSGFSGGSGSFSGMGNTQAEDDGLYSLNKLTVASVTSQEKMTVSITIDELDITKIYVGQTAKITLNVVAAEAVEATVSAISNEGTNSGGSSKFTVELTLDKQQQMLPGMNVSAVLTLNSNETALCVPAAAVDTVKGKTVVYTALDEKTGRPCSAREVTIGAADADYVQILEGLSEGETVYYEYYETASPTPSSVTIVSTDRTDQETTDQTTSDSGASDWAQSSGMPSQDGQTGSERPSAPSDQGNWSQNAAVPSGQDGQSSSERPSAPSGQADWGQSSGTPSGQDGQTGSERPSAPSGQGDWSQSSGNSSGQASG